MGMMMKMGQGDLDITGTETGEDGEEQLEMRAAILRWNPAKPGRTRQIRNTWKMMKKMRKDAKVGKAKMRRNRIKNLIRKGKKRRPTRRKKTKKSGSGSDYDSEEELITEEELAKLKEEVEEKKKLIAMLRNKPWKM